MKKTYSKSNKIEKLLDETTEAYYWIGFLLADGGFENRKQSSFGIKLGISKKDEIVLLNLYNFLEATQKIYYYSIKGFNYCSLTIFNTEIVQKIKQKFDIKQNKTCFPPNISLYKKFKDELLISLIIGFIDGDGCIKHQTGRTDCILTLKIHSSWLNFLIFIQEFLSEKSGTQVPKPIINNAGYARIIITNMKTLRFLKNFINENNLPILKRKWDKVDEHRLSNAEKKELVFELYNDGKSVIEIMEILNIQRTTVTSKLNKLGIKFYDKNYNKKQENN